MGTAAGQRSRATFQRDITHVILLAAFDAFAMFEALVNAFSIRNAEQRPFIQPVSQSHFALVAVLLTPLWISFFAIGGLYNIKANRGRTNELGRICGVVLAGVGFLIVLDYMRFLGPIFPGRVVPVYSLLLGVALVALCRQLARRLLLTGWKRGHGLRNVILIGCGAITRRITEELLRPTSGYRVLAVVCPREDGASYSNVPVFPTLETALEGRLDVVDEVLQADVELPRSEVERLMAHVTSLGLVYRFVPNQYGVYAASSSLSTIAGVPVMDVRLTSLGGWGAVYKRAFDLIGVSLLLVLFAPFFLCSAAVIKVTDPQAPVFYWQTRLGRGGRPIRVMKFRTMGWKYSTGPKRPYTTPIEAFAAMGRHDLCAEFLRDQKVRDDPRISGFGRLLRRISFDELPQLVNVLKGELSLIGPRPITPEELDRYGSQRVSFLALRPGITGLWQVSGRSDVSYDERVKLDIFYVENWSVKLDLTILAKTTTAVLARRGAY